MMDPDANLKEQKQLAAEIFSIWDDCNGDGSLPHAMEELAAEKAQELAEKVAALDSWLGGGGSFPLAWQNAVVSAIRNASKTSS